MQTITIAEQLWLEPTLLGVTLNFTDRPHGWHYRVGIGFQSLSDCDKALKEVNCSWTMRDKSLTIEGERDITLTFCPGTYMERCVKLNYEELHAFKNAIHYLTLANIPSQN